MMSYSPTLCWYMVMASVSLRQHASLKGLQLMRFHATNATCVTVTCTLSLSTCLTLPNTSRQHLPPTETRPETMIQSRKPILFFNSGRQILATVVWCGYWVVAFFNFHITHELTSSCGSGSQPTWHETCVVRLVLLLSIWCTVLPCNSTTALVSNLKSETINNLYIHEITLHYNITVISDD